MSEKYSIAVIGLGNEFRGDDAVGLYIARRLKDKRLPGVRVVEGVSDGTTLIETWQDTRGAVLIDCVSSGNQVGKIHRFDPLVEEIPEKFFPAYSTHAFNITDTVRLAETIGQLPPHLIVYGVEGASFSTGAEMSDRVMTAANRVVEMVLKDIENFR